MDEMFAEEKSALQEGWAATYPQLWIFVVSADSFWIVFPPCKFFPFLLVVFSPACHGRSVPSI